MDAARWKRINTLFDQVLERPAADRAAFLAGACSDDPGLRAEVEKLLAAHARAGEFIETPAVEALTGTDSHGGHEGRVIGPWRILREIGAGGMGTVHLAERADGQFEQKIALKLIRRGMDTDSVLRRFHNERRILAQLDHPHIARLYDGGTTDDGLPYFAMEFIEGEPIDRWCDAQRLGITERLDLFRQVCAAVAFAHQNLVVHRDIKPSNVLVGADGRARLLDFGIARILSNDDTDEPRTATGMLVMTPEYASPEQVRGERATTLSDVYALGVMLYGLLCGRPPHRFATRSYAEILRVLESSDPGRPSVAIGAMKTDADGEGASQPSAETIAAARATTPERLRRRLAGDLDTIVLKALHRDPRRRYASAEQLSEDLRRHLAGLPVSARPDTVGYRVRKFVQRNRAGAIAAALVLVSLIAGVGATSWQAARAREAQARAERRFADLRKLARSVMFDYHDAIKDLAGATPIRERFVRDGLEYLDGLARDAGNDPSLQRELAEAYDRLADVQGGTMFANLGDTEGALESFGKAQRIYEALWNTDSTDARMRRGYGNHLVQRAKLVWERGEIREALALLGRATAIFEALVAETPDDAGLQRLLLTAVDTDGMVHLDAGEARTAVERARRQIEIAEWLVANAPGDPGARRAASVAYEHMSNGLLALGDFPGALAQNGRARDLRAALVAEFPLNAELRRTLAVSHYYEGEILARLGRHREAMESYRKDVEIVEALSKADPKNQQYRGDRAYAYIRIGDMAAQLGDPRAALKGYRTSLALRSADVAADTSNLWKRASLIEARAKMAKTLARLGDEAYRNHSAEAERLMDVTQLEPNDAQLRSFFATTHADLGDAEVAMAGAAGVAAARDHWRAALESYRRGDAIWKDLEARGILLDSDREYAERTAREIVRCEAALGGPAAAGAVAVPR